MAVVPERAHPVIQKLIGLRRLKNPKLCHHNRYINEKHGNRLNKMPYKEIKRKKKGVKL